MICRWGCSTFLMTFQGLLQKDLWCLWCFVGIEERGWKFQQMEVIFQQICWVQFALLNLFPGCLISIDLSCDKFVFTKFVENLNFSSFQK